VNGAANYREARSLYSGTMFRTARGFLLVAPPAFALALLSYLASHPHGAQSFTPYPFLAEALGQTLVKKPVLRFVTTSTVFFLLPYLVTGLLLFFADLGIGAATPLWKSSRKTRPVPLLPEWRVTFLAVTLVGAVVLGASLHRIAHGGELPGGINVAPIFVSLVPFGAIAAAFVVATLVALPRSLLTRPSREARAA